MSDASPELWTVVLPALEKEDCRATLGGRDARTDVGQVREAIEELRESRDEAHEMNARLRAEVAHMEKHTDILQRHELDAYVAQQAEEEIAPWRERAERAAAENKRLQGVLVHIAAGGSGATLATEAVLRRWAFEAVTHGRGVSELTPERKP